MMHMIILSWAMRSGAHTPSSGLVSESGREWRTLGRTLEKTSSLLDRRSSRFGRSSGESCACGGC